MNARQQFYEIIAQRFSEIETLKSAAMERGEIICNVTDAFLNGEISQEDYDDLISQVTSN